MPPVLRTERIAHSLIRRRLLHCGISILPMPGSGQTRPSGMSAQCPVCAPKADIRRLRCDVARRRRFIPFANPSRTLPSRPCHSKELACALERAPSIFSMVMTYTEATTSQSRDRGRAESRWRYGVCTNLPLASQTEQRWPKWSLRSTRQTDPHLLAVSRPVRG
jgi:hypothetical protein